MPKAKQEKRRTASGHAYTVYFLPDLKDGGYTAHIPALGVVTEGRTLREARVMARDAVEGYLEAAVELGHSIPADVTVEQVKVAV